VYKWVNPQPNTQITVIIPGTEVRVAAFTIAFFGGEGIAGIVGEKGGAGGVAQFAEGEVLFVVELLAFVVGYPAAATEMVGMIDKIDSFCAGIGFP
jgi:hypothetical protein